MQFIKSMEMKIDLTDEQADHLCSKENIKIIAKKRGIITYDIFDEDKLIGFAQLRR